MADEIGVLVEELYATADSLEEQGLLDDRFIANYELKPDDGSMYFIDLVQRFHQNIRLVMRDLALALELPALDYADIRDHYVKIKRIVIRIGVSALNRPLEVLRLGVASSSREECQFALVRMHQEYHKLRPHLETIIELERRIVNLENYLARLGGN